MSQEREIAVLLIESIRSLVTKLGVSLCALAPAIAGLPGWRVECHFRTPRATAPVADCRAKASATSCCAVSTNLSSTFPQRGLTVDRIEKYVSCPLLLLVGGAMLRRGRWVTALTLVVLIYLYRRPAGESAEDSGLKAAATWVLTEEIENGPSIAGFVAGVESCR